jgi:hypothetical protein
MVLPRLNNKVHRQGRVQWAEALSPPCRKEKAPLPRGRARKKT